MSHDHDHGTMDMAPASSPLGHGGGGMMMHMMQMTFYWGKDVQILFSGWETDNAAEYVFSLVAIFLIAAIHQWLASFRTTLLGSIRASKEANSLNRPFLVHRLMLTVLFGINAITGYALMLMAMTFNVGIFLVIIAGLTVAYFFFNPWTENSTTNLHV